MLITCPSCSRDHPIDAARIGATGRKVRCAGCRESWFVAPFAAEHGGFGTIEGPAGAPTSAIESPEPAAGEAARPFAPPIVDVEVEVRPRPAARRAPAGRKGAKPKRKAASRGPGGEPASGGGWGRRLGIAAALLLTAAPLVVLYRVKVVTALPRTAGLFATAGLPVNVVGLSFENVRSSLGRGPIGPVLAVEGRIVNMGRSALPVPPLQVAIEDEDGIALYGWTAEAAEAEVAPGASVGFTGRLPSPPPAGRRVRVTFGDGSSRATLASR